MSAEQGSTTACPQCGAELAAAETRCWLCLNERRPAGEADTAGTVEAPAAQRPERWTYSLGSLLLFITLIAVTLGLMGVSPGIGIVFGVLATPALIRTAVAASRARAAGEGLNGYEKAWIFLASAGIVLCTGLAAGVAFYGICWAGFVVVESVGGLEAGLSAGIILGIIGGILVLALMIRWLWPLRKRRP